MGNSTHPGSVRRNPMNTVENTVGGTYREGKIVLDRAMNWAEGTRVVVQLMPEGYLIEGVWPADGSPEGEAEIQHRMAELDKEEVSPEEAADFASAIEEVRQFHRAALPKRTDAKP
jgi:hypothetical protein